MIFTRLFRSTTRWPLLAFLFVVVIRTTESVQRILVLVLLTALRPFWVN